MNPITKARKAKQAKQPKSHDNAPAAAANAPPPGPPPARPSLRVSPPYVPFPIDTLPGRMAEFVGETAEVMGCDPCQIALPMKAIAGGLIGNLRMIHLKQTWQEAPIIWAVVVADSSSTKSPAYKIIERPLVDLQIKVNDSSREKRELFLADCTIEHVGTVLQASPRGTILAMDELSAWFSGFTRYRKTGSDCPIWCQLWQCGTYKKDRADPERPNIFVPNACCSVTGTMTPGNLAGVFSTPGLFETGLLFRPLYAMPPSRNQPWDEREVKPRTLNWWTDRCRTLLDLEGRVTLHLDEPAKKLWIDYYNGVRERINMSPLLVRAALIKLRAYTARFALLHFLLGCPDGSAGVGKISAPSMAAAIKLSGWFADEADRVFLLRGESEDRRELRDLADAIQRRGGRITARELQRSNNRRWPTKEAAVASLQALADAGFGNVWEEGTSTIFQRHDAQPGAIAVPGDEVPQADPPTPETASPADEAAQPPAASPETASGAATTESDDAADQPFPEAKLLADIIGIETDLFERKREAARRDQWVRDIAVGQIDVPVETRNLLIKHKLKTLGDLLDFDAQERPGTTAQALGKLDRQLAGRPAERVVCAIKTAIFSTSPTCRTCARNIGLDVQEGHAKLCFECQAMSGETIPFPPPTNEAPAKRGRPPRGNSDD